MRSQRCCGRLRAAGARRWWDRAVRAFARGSAQRSGGRYTGRCAAIGRRWRWGRSGRGRRTGVTDFSGRRCATTLRPCGSRLTGWWRLWHLTRPSPSTARWLRWPSWTSGTIGCSPLPPTPQRRKARQRRCSCSVVSQVRRELPAVVPSGSPYVADAVRQPSHVSHCRRVFTVILLQPSNHHTCVKQVRCQPFHAIDKDSAEIS